MEKSAHKLELLRRIEELEKKGLWHLDVEDDPETYPLMPDKVDYLNEKLSSKIKNKIDSIPKCFSINIFIGAPYFLSNHATK